MVRAKSYGDGKLGVQLPLVLPYAGGFVGAAVSSANGGFTPYLFLTDSEGRTGCSEYECETMFPSSGAAMTVTDITEEVQMGTAKNLQLSTGRVYEEEVR